MSEKINELRRAFVSGARFWYFCTVGTLSGEMMPSSDIELCEKEALRKYPRIIMNNIFETPSIMYIGDKYEKGFLEKIAIDWSKSIIRGSLLVKPENNHPNIKKKNQRMVVFFDFDDLGKTIIFMPSPDPYPTEFSPPLSAPDAPDGRKTGENGGVG